MYINISINLSKIDKARIIEGKKGKYLNITGFISEDKDEFGNDIAVWQQQTEEERKNKDKRNYLGNGRKQPKREEPKPSTPPANEPDPFQSTGGKPAQDEELDDLPF